MRLCSWTSLAAALVAATLLSGCPDSVGITCPEGVNCNGDDDLSVPPLDQSILPDLSRLADLSRLPDLPRPRDLSRLPDLSQPVDMAMCKAQCPLGCCDTFGVCQKPSLSTCGTGAAMCVVCDATIADTCAADGCKCGITSACNPGQRCLNSE